MVAAAKPSAAQYRARATSRGYILCSPPGWPSMISGAGAGADPGVHRMPGISPRVNSRWRTPSSRRCSEVHRMVVPFGSAPETALPDDLPPDRDPQGEHPCRHVHGYHLLGLLHGLRKVAAVAVVC